MPPPPLASLADTAQEPNNVSKYIPLHPSLLPRITFSWFNETIAKGGVKPITKNEMLQLPTELTSRYVLSKFANLWIASGTKPKKIMSVLHQLVFVEFWFAGTCRLLNDVFQLASTILIKHIVQSAQSNDFKQTLLAASLLLLSSLLQTILLQQFIHGVFMSGSRVVSTTTSLLFHASISLKMHKMNPVKSVAEINNVQAKDSNSLRDFVVFFHNLWACPLVIIACTILLINFLGYAGLVPVIILPALIPIEAYITKKSRIVRKNVLQKSDRRMSLINELIDGIFTVKLTQLIPHMHARIAKLRSDELAEAWRGMLIEVLNTVVTRSGALLITFLTFAVYTQTSVVPLTADVAFSALAVINLLGRPLQVLPKYATMLSEGLVSFSRIESIVQDGLRFNPRMFEDMASPSRNKVSPIAYVSVSATNITVVRMPTATVVLSNVSFTLPRIGLVIITGANASGKTSLLLSLLNELALPEGSVSENGGKCAYVGHDPWIINGSVKENILLASADSDDEARYAESIKQCALTLDIANWYDGDETLIGEKGINISGGQRQRIALARACNSASPVFLLDAPLSGLDVIVGKLVFNECLVKESKTRLVIVTDVKGKRDMLCMADRVIRLGVGGVVEYCGDNGDCQGCDDKSGAEESKAINEVTVDAVESESLVEYCASESEKEKDAIKTVGKFLSGSKNKKRQQTDDVTPLPKTTKIETETAYFTYFAACGRTNIAIAIALSIASYGAAAFADYQVAFFSDGEFGVAQFLKVYSLLSALVIVLNIARYYTYSNSGINASKTLHNTLLHSILHATFPFFTDTPSGRITSRFSVDFDTIDFSIPSSLSSLIDALLGIVTGVVVVCISMPLYILVIVPLSWQYMSVQKQYRLISKDLKRLDAGMKAPLQSNFREVLNGLETIRGYGIQAQCISRHHELLDASIRSRLNWDFDNRWMGFRLDVIGSVIIGAAAFSVAFSTYDDGDGVSVSGSSSGGEAGIIIAYAMKATQSLTFAIRASTALENMFTSVERVEEYVGVEQEDQGRPAVTNNATKPALDFTPITITIAKTSTAKTSTADSNEDVVLEGRNITARYSRDLPQVLKNVTFKILKGELIGICGRTGSGKSSLTLLISRALAGFDGDLLIRGENCNGITLKKYRQSIAVFPQNTYIFSGAVRDYLDPRRVYTDDKLKSVLGELWGAFDGTSTNILDLAFVLTAGGGNLSVGEAQVVALARASLASCSVVVLDEITSNMDIPTAARAMAIVKRELTMRGIGVVIVAHSLKEVMECDVVWVMEGGEIVERGRPDDLVREGGVFKGMVGNSIGKS